MDTAIVIFVPEAERLVGSWRDRFDPAAAEGMPAHITLMVPFRPWADIDSEVHSRLAALFVGAPSFNLTFRSVRRFPQAVWLAPEPPGALAALTHKITALFPGCRPYGGVFDEVVPHLTVAHLGSPDAADRVEREFAADAVAGLPLQMRVRDAVLLHKKDGCWFEERRYPLGS